MGAPLRVFFASMHPTFSRSFGVMLRRAGCVVYTPDHAFAHAIRGYYQNTEPIEIAGTTQISQEDFDKTPMDILFLLCVEQEKGNWWKYVAGGQSNARVVHYAGNDSVPYNAEKVNYLLAADRSTQSMFPKANVLRFYPILPLEDFPTPEPDRAHRAHSKVGSYVINLDKFWPVDWKLHEQVRGLLRDISVKYHSGARRWDCHHYMRQSLLTMHFKGAEGYGFSVLESLAQGVPVLSTRRLVTARTLSEFIIPGETGWLVDTAEEAVEIIHEMNVNRDELQRISTNAAQRGRDIIYEPTQVDNLRNFLENL